MDGWECKFQEADSTPTKSQLDFKDFFVGSNVSIAACPIQGTSFTTGTDDSRQANDNRVMPSIAKIKYPVCHIDFEVAPENQPLFFRISVFQFGHLWLQILFLIYFSTSI